MWRLIVGFLSENLSDSRQELTKINKERNKIKIYKDPKFVLKCNLFSYFEKRGVKESEAKKIYRASRARTDSIRESLSFDDDMRARG